MAYCVCIAALVFVSRYLTRGGLYFVDGPRIVRAIHNHTYVIQPPGYWIYAHIGAMFHDPAYGLLLVNELFSAAGAVIFFLLSRQFGLSTKTAVLTALAYSSIFFVWFAGDIQSSYASQILFAPLTIYLFLLYQNRRSSLRISYMRRKLRPWSRTTPLGRRFSGTPFYFSALCFRAAMEQADRIINFYGIAMPGLVHPNPAGTSTVP